MVDNYLSCHKRLSVLCNTNFGEILIRFSRIRSCFDSCRGRRFSGRPSFLHSVFARSTIKHTKKNDKTIADEKRSDVKTIYIQACIIMLDNKKIVGISIVIAPCSCRL